MPGGIAVAFVLTVLFCWVVFRLGFLSRSGAIAATALGTIVLGLGGWAWVFPLLAFFISSSLLSKARSCSQRVVEEVRGLQRDAVQVLANGGIAGAVVLIATFWRHDLYSVYLGALAAANADTWSTEIGIMLGRNPRSIVSGKPVPPGTSGGVTLAGTLAALIGAALIAWIGRLSQHTALESGTLLAVTIAGLGGSLCDSVLGATLQARCRCRVCSKETEKPSHCGQPTDFARGLCWLDNDGVNLLCASVGALCAALLTA